MEQELSKSICTKTLTQSADTILRCFCLLKLQCDSKLLFHARAWWHDPQAVILEKVWSPTSRDKG